VRADVNLATERATVEHLPSVTRADLAAAVKGAGYEVASSSTNDSGQDGESVDAEATARAATYHRLQQKSGLRRRLQRDHLPRQHELVQLPAQFLA
jgi:cation transport ATPase